MKRIQLLVMLFAGGLAGFLGGVAITAAHSTPPKFDADQVVAQAGETKLTRGEMAQLLFADYGDKYIDGQLRDMLIVQEEARKAGVTVSADEVEQRVKDSLEFSRYVMAKSRMEAVPHWLLAEQMRPVLLLEKILNLSVSDKEVGEYYRKNLGLFTRPAMADLVCIVTKDKAEADRALRRLKDGEDPGMLSAQISCEPLIRERKGQMGWFTRDAMSPAVALAVFEGNDGEPLKPKQFTKVMMLYSGAVSPNNPGDGEMEYFIFYVNSIERSVTPSLKDVYPAALYYARAKKLTEQAPRWFKEHVGKVDWKHLKHFGDPQAELTPFPLSPETYFPSNSGANAADK